MRKWLKISLITIISLVLLLIGAHAARNASPDRILKIRPLQAGYKGGK